MYSLPNFSRLVNFRPLLAALLFCCSGPLLAAEPLRVAVSPDYEPMAFMRDGKLVGLEIDNALAVATVLGRELKFVEMEMDGFIAALGIGKVDVVMSGFSVTPKRQAQVDYTEAFMEIGQMVIVRTSDVVRFSHPKAMYQEGMRIGVEPGTTGEAYAIEHFPHAKLQNFRDPAAAFTALRLKATDAYIHDAPTSWALATSSENQDLFSLYRPLTTEKLAWAVRKGNKILLEQLNSALDELRANGHLQVIRNSWIPVTVEVR
jgi:ABC-type amino acid transport substrate-binding protein